MWIPGPRFNIKMLSYQYRKSHCGDKTILRPSYLRYGISYTGKTTSLYWIRAQGLCILSGNIQGISKMSQCKNGVLQGWAMPIPRKVIFILKHFLHETSLQTVLWNPKHADIKQGKSEGFDSCDRPSNLTQIGLKLSIFQTLWSWNLMDDPKNNRAPLLCYFKLFASFHSHWWIQTGVTVRKPLIWVNIDAFLSRVTLKFDGWPSKIIGHLFNATSSFVQHFIAIGEFKLELESGNTQSGSNSTLFRAVWPWNLTDDLQKQQGTSSVLLQALCIIS